MSKIINLEDFSRVFFESSNQWFHVRELARILRLNPTTVSKYTHQLYKSDFLHLNKERLFILWGGRGICFKVFN